MWPWRRRPQRTAQRSTAETRAPDGGGPAATAGAPGGGPATTAPARAPGEPPAWQGLPPIQRVTPDEPRLNLPDAFTGSLAAWRDPSYLAPLGHLVGAGEPAGVLHDAAVPVSGPSPAAVAPEAAHPAGGPAPLPLATPPSAAPRPTASPLQRHVADAGPGRTPDAAPSRAPDTGLGRAPDAGPSERPSAGFAVRPSAVPPQRPVPVEPLAVSRLVTAPPPPQELHLPAVDVGPADVDPTIGGATIDDPTDAGPTGWAAPEPAVTPTLGAGGADTGTDAGDAVTSVPDGAATGGDAAQGSAVGGPRAVPDLPVQRAPGEPARPPRRLGLGEPIVSPVSPAGPPRGAPPPPVQRTRAGDTAAPPLPPSPAVGSYTVPIQRSPGGDDRPATGERFGAEVPAGQRGGADGPPGEPGGTDDTAGVTSQTETGTPPDDRSAPLVGDGEITVSRLDAEVSATGEGPSLAGPPGAGSTGGDARPSGDPTPPAGLPVAGPTAGTPARGGPADAGTGTPPPVQTYVPPTGVELAPLLGQFSALPPVDAGGGDPFAATSATPSTTTPLTATPSTTAPVGAPSDSGGGPPLVVARLVGDRPPPLLTGAMPPAPAPEQPRVQRVTWQRDEPSAPADATRVAATGDGTTGDGTATDGTTGNGAATDGTTGDTGAGPVGPLTVVAPVDGHPPAATPIAAPDALALATRGSPPEQADGGPPPVQRWVGALPDVPVRGQHAGSPLAAYPQVQRAEPVDATVPPADPPPAAEPAAGGGGSAGQPGTAGGARGGGAVEPEELLKKLYDPLLRRLKTELRLDRERHGVLGGPG
ncbi:hypothetical protein [Micromonospora okii]|uniref:hypothetical protein n=1 Tax=Micromonospora okii TaxID=1182970 RepID=UPI001E41FF5F|nr:hypothetical protein [Micromonospora okii]